MVDLSKITSAHYQRLAIVYVRQSSPGQVQRNPESTARQYEFVSRALDLGWQRNRVLVIDEDQGTSANGLAVRSGFGHLTAEERSAKNDRPARGRRQNGEHRTEPRRRDQAGRR